MLIVIYIYAAKPFTSKFDNKLEGFNEICIMFSSVHLIMFTDLVPDQELQFKVGYSIIAVIFINMAVNMYLILKDQLASLRSLYQKAKKWREARKMQREKNYLKEGDVSKSHSTMIVNNSSD